MDYFVDFLHLLEGIFPAAVVAKGLQRGVLLSGMLLLVCGAYMMIFRPAGTWAYYRQLRMRKIDQAAEMVDEVARLEGRADALELRLELLQKVYTMRRSHAVELQGSIGEAVSVPDRLLPPPTTSDPRGVEDTLPPPARLEPPIRPRLMI
jgi:hypothetical protein